MLAPDMAMVLPAPAVTMGAVVLAEVLAVVEEPGMLPVPAAVEAVAVVVPLDQTGAVVARVLAVVQVEQATEATVVTGLVMVQGQSVMVRVVAWNGSVSMSVLYE